ncbi:MAG: thiamine pyrophosphate-dependent enzyme, partial [Alphaproteobacteria bacterium]
DQYLCVRALSDLLKGGENIVVDGGGTNVYITFQGFKVKPDQRVMLTSSLGAMGSGLPEALGAYFANGRPTICLVGDGSFMLNVQELSTIRRHNIPMKIFVFNNGGYVSIRETQSGFLGARFAGSSEEGGLHLPSFTKVAEAFEIPAMAITDRSRVASEMAKFLAWDGPGLCEIVLSPLQAVRPRQNFAARPDGTNVAMPLDQMFPPLPDDTLRTLSPWTVGAGRG